MDVNLRNEVIRWQEKLFKRSVRRQMRLRELRELIGITTNQNCLEITAGDGMISTRLRDGGGRWKTLVLSNDVKTALDWFVPDQVEVLQDSIKEADGTFDLVVIVDALERVRDDYAFIKECHRVLKSDGRLVVTAARKMLCLGTCPLRSMLGLSWRAKGLERPGYTSGEFFEVLKDGFDVPETDSYSTCCVELPGLLCEAAANKLLGGLYNMPGENTGTEEFYHYTKLNIFATLVYPLMWVLARLEEKLFFFAPGHNMVAKTKRRVWRARKQPVLIDGRSIAEAAINTKIGTAAPF
ncbi:MAG TPA: methyltransferase domain-containing protein [Pontiellaceae bacterium]|nr:methyltransferase domain-containing protein [Pontiellaceae bacterium]HPR82955.1 methyltransferase domain-containing protein [Pontiellaceae bacterium]